MADLAPSAVPKSPISIMLRGGANSFAARLNNAVRTSERDAILEQKARHDALCVCVA